MMMKTVTRMMIMLMVMLIMMLAGDDKDKDDNDDNDNCNTWSGATVTPWLPTQTASAPTGKFVR